MFFYLKLKKYLFRTNRSLVLGSMTLPRNFKALPPKKVKTNTMSMTRKNGTLLFSKKEILSQNT